MSLVGGDGDDMSDGRGVFVVHISLCAVVVVDVVGMVDARWVVWLSWLILVAHVRLGSCC